VEDMGRTAQLLLAVSLLGAVLLGPAARPATAESNNSALSPYWGRSITQWADLIAYYGGTRGLDPDLIAAMIYEESHGNAGLISSAGAVGLMQIMPREVKGFEWRPPRAELLESSVNLFWGTRTFGQVLQQAEGSVDRALAAYNGGWEQEMLRAPQIYKSKVLDHYARALAARAGYDARSMKAWKLVVDIHSSGGLSRRHILKSDGTTLDGAGFDLSKLPDSTPHAVTYSAIDDDNTAWLVETWLIVEPIEGGTPDDHGTY